MGELFYEGVGFVPDGERDQDRSLGRHVGWVVWGLVQGIASLATCEEFLVGGEGEERPGIPVHVVLEVVDFWETGSGGGVLGPGAVGVLGFDEVLDAALDTGAMGVAEGEESHEGPGGLGGGGRAAAFEDGVFVGIAAFAPAAVGVLDALEPVAGFDDPRFVHVDLEGAESAE